MPKVRTNKTAAKRFKISGTGKLICRHARVNHLMISKRRSRARRLRADGQVVGGDRARMRRMLTNAL
jgi:large subunit ribosomal protein L35